MKPWNEYPIGTKAFSVSGGYWTKTKRGWKWCTGDTFPTPGGDAYRVTLPVEKEFICDHCKNQIEEMVMLKNEIWLSIAENRKILLCPSCIESRLKRTITSDDLMYLKDLLNLKDPKIPVNIEYAKSHNLNY